MISTHQPAISTAPSLQLTSMPQLAEAKSSEDNWTGIKDAAARRRAQTRLHTRAYRKRKAIVKKTEASSSATGTSLESEAPVECSDIKQECVSVVSASRVKQLYNARGPLLPYRPRHGKERVDVFFPLCPDHFITLLQYNALRASAVNRTLISGILATSLDCVEETTHIVPYPTKPELIPSSLLPTTLQQTVPHGDWIDMFPCPPARDLLIQANGTFDEDDLWADCIGGLYEGFPDDEIERRGIVAWSPPWEITGWEMSEGFVKKWGWLFKGLPGPLEATNRWRMERGEEPLEYGYIPQAAA
ncbi:hypothetical protein SCUP234_03285 [Seiridium cupressi]